MRPCLVFDLDDTLFPERDFVESGMSAVAETVKKEFGRPDAEATLAEVRSGNNGRRVFNELLVKLGLGEDESVVRRLVEIYRNHRPRLSLYSDAGYLLRATEGLVDTAIVTDGFRRTQMNKLEAIGMEHRFAPVVCTFDRGPEWHKPSTLPFQEVARVHGGNAERFVYVGDNATKDFGGPAALGWTTVHILRPNGRHFASPAQDPADFVVTDLREIIGIIGVTPSVSKRT